MPVGSAIKPLISADCHTGCHLQAIESVGGCFSWPEGVKEFDRLLKRNHGEGTFEELHFTGTIVSFQRENTNWYKQTVEELKKRDFVLLGTQKGAHGSYKMELWGQGFTLPKREKC